MRPPVYPKKPHKTGQARIKVGGKTIYLGVWGSPESYTKYQGIIEQFRLAQLGQPMRLVVPAANQPSVRDVLTAFLAAAEGGGRPTSKQELVHFRHCLRAVESSGLAERRAAAFDAESLAELGRAMQALGWGRRHVNRQMGRVRTVWRWAERKRLVPDGAWSHLLTLPIGNGECHETVLPVPEDDLDRTLPHLGRIPRAIVEAQLLTGARPGEILKLTPRMFHRSGAFKVGGGKVQLGRVWVADLALAHKTGWRGHRKVIFFGPKAQAVVAPFLDRAADAPLFSPAEAVAEYLAAAKRRDGSPVRKRTSGKRRPGSAYSVWTYENAIERACKRAGVEKWNPGQLRHNAASRLSEEFGPEIARIILGHRELRMTRNYVQDDLRRAAEAMGEAG